ncbi:MAG: 1-deoxy-D-xylulose-5-phosphate synthase, partial [Alphaproteobacteria bacterium]|nr:1-deoxy-D-xylulose-5-phosphate synthase [Alphaproteobacteria bacterium]
DELELMHMVATAAAYDAGPIAFRYPRGEGTGVTLPAKGDILPIGQGRIVKHGTTESPDIALLVFGTRMTEALKAASELERLGFSVTVADARFAKPLDESLIQKLIATHKVMLTLEEGACGGFGAHVLETAANKGWLDAGNCKLRVLTLPDSYQAQDKPERMYDEAGLNAPQIVLHVCALMGVDGKASAA